MDSEHAGSRAITLVVIAHARDPWDEETLWVAPGKRDKATAEQIADGSPPPDAVAVFGPAKMHVVDQLSEKLRYALSLAGLEVTSCVVPDD